MSTNVLYRDMQNNDNNPALLGNFMDVGNLAANDSDFLNIQEKKASRVELPDQLDSMFSSGELRRRKLTVTFVPSLSFWSHPAELHTADFDCHQEGSHLT